MTWENPVLNTSDPLFEFLVNVEGVDEWKASLRSCHAGMMAELAMAMTENTTHLLDAAIPETPILKGYLRGSGIAQVNGYGIVKVIRSVDFNGQKLFTPQGLPIQEVAPFINAPGLGQLDENGAFVRGIVAFTRPYALEQHENPTYRHPRGGKWKYLEHPLARNTPAYIENIAQHSERGLGLHAFSASPTP